MTKQKIKKHGVRLWHVIVFLLVVVFIYLAGCCWSIYSFAKVDQKQPADVAIVLGAGSYNGEISPVFRERINHGVWLYKNGYVKKLILTGGYGQGSDCSDARAAMLYAQSQGVDREDMLLEESSGITQENIQNAKTIMDANDLTSAIIVSDPLHMRRAMLMAGDYGIKGYSSPTPTSRYISCKTKIPFLTRELFLYAGYRIYRIFE